MPNSDTPSPAPSADVVAKATSELNNLLQIIAGSSSALEKAGKHDHQTSQYLQMLRTSIGRAETVGQELAKQAGGAVEQAIYPGQVPVAIESKTPARNQSARRTI